MCGICGILSFDPQPIARDLHAMNRKLHHRGPDDEGYFLWNSAQRIFCHGDISTVSAKNSQPHIRTSAERASTLGFAHTRFSIIDLTDAGHQPFASDDGSVVLVFNGEIYNYRELRAELEAKGFTFRSNTDTEVLLNAYIAWGTECFARFNGMWAVAIFDEAKRKVLFSRDRIGKKQIYYYRSGRAFYFASEIAALFAVPEIWESRAIEESAIFPYLLLGVRNDVDGSLFKNVRLFPAAHFAWLDLSGNLDLQRYWSIPTVKRLKATEVSIGAATEKLGELLRDSVRLRLRADVPIAAELSSGVDSAAILASASSLLREKNDSHAINAYTIKYADPRFDESVEAKAVADHLGITHRTVLQESQNYWDSAEELIGLQQQPYESPNLISSFSMWKAMRDSKVRVSLSGGGADEIFAGYTQSYLGPYFYQLIAEGKLRLALTEVARWNYPLTALRNAMTHACADRSKLATQLMLSRNLRSLEGVLRTDLSSNGALSQIAGDRMKGNLDAALRRSFTRFPVPMYVCHNDKQQMHVPIEVRYPFLDHRIIEFGFSLPIEYLVHNGFSKYVLRQSVKDALPPGVTARRTKTGFPVPLRKWMDAGKITMAEQFGKRQRSGRFVDGPRLLRDFDTIDEMTLWRCHQVELWMTAFDLA